MNREYPLTCFELDSTGGQIITIRYTLFFSDQAKMVVKEYRSFNHPFKEASASIIPPDSFDKHTVNGSPLRQLVLKKLEEILPPPN
jgi:hypothetical protein